MTTANPETPSEPISKAVRGRQSRAREREGEVGTGFVRRWRRGHLGSPLLLVLGASLFSTWRL